MADFHGKQTSEAEAKVVYSLPDMKGEKSCLPSALVVPNICQQLNSFGSNSISNSTSIPD